MSDLVEFLRARIAEDEQAAQRHRKVRGDIGGRPCPRCGEPATGYGTPINGGVVRVTHHGDTFGCDLTDEEWAGFGDGGPTDDGLRRLAECEAKRKIIDLHRPRTRRNTGTATFPGEDTVEDCICCDQFPARYPCETLRLLALPYAGHQDWREEGRP